MQHVMRVEGLCPSRLSKLTKYAISRSQHRPYASKINAAFEAESQPTVKNEDGSKTLRSRQHGNSNLPMPPMLDPKAIEAKQRHKEPKARPVEGDEEPSDFQKELKLNPYARALASTVRQCRITEARLPSHFLVPFAAQIPVEPRKPESKPSLFPAISIDTSGRLQTYVVAAREALEYLNSKKGKWWLLVNERIKNRVALAEQKGPDKLNAKDFFWNTKMPEMVLAQLRWVVFEKLRRCLQYEENFVRLGGEGAGRDDLACILRFESETSEIIEGEVHDRIPTYDLSSLMSPEQIQKLQNDCSLQDTQSIALAKHSRTLAVRMALAKLQNYV